MIPDPSVRAEPASAAAARAAALPARLGFRGWEIRPRERVVRVGGEPVKLGARAFDVLLALVGHRDRVVTKDELLAAAWPGLVVEENNLMVQVAGLRRVLGSRVIATVTGIGYRLAADDEGAAGAAGDDGVDGDGDGAHGGAPAPAGAAGADTAAPAPAGQAGTTSASGVLSGVSFGVSLGVPLATPFATPSGPPGLIGRDFALGELLAALQAAPLVSIVGPGGVGKTTLARAALARLPAPAAGPSPRWVDLAPLAAGTPLGPQVGAALGIAPEAGAATPGAFAAALQHAQALVVLDNCEHLADEVAALVEAALAVAPGLRWLVTSQEPLRVPGEAVLRLAPLAVPAEDAGPEAALAAPALGLLVQRVRAADPGFQLAGVDLPAACEICRELDGLPLAIEMAAARIASLGVLSVRGQLLDRLRLRHAGRGMPERQQTLRRTLDWSYRLLTPLEQAVFRRLAPFRGGFTPALAVALCGLHADGHDGEELAADDVLDALAALVDKSLVQRDAAGGGRLHLFASARAYAQAQLAQAVEAAAAAERHADVLAATFAPAFADWLVLPDREWEARYAPERENLRAALDTAVGLDGPGAAARLAQLAGALALLDSRLLRRAEVTRLPLPFERLADAPPGLRATARLHIGWAHYGDGARDLAADLIEQALADFDALGDACGSFIALSQLARLCESRAGHAARVPALLERLRALPTAAVPLRAQLHCEIFGGPQYGGRNLARLEALCALCEHAGFDALASICRTHVTDEHLCAGRFAEAEAVATRMLEAGETRPRSRAFIHHNRALARVRLGRAEAAKADARELLRVLPGAAHQVLDLFAYAAADAGRCFDAALLLGHADEAKRRRGLQADPAEQALRDAARQHIAAAMAPAELDGWLATGAAMGERELLALALG